MIPFAVAAAAAASDGTVDYCGLAIDLSPHYSRRWMRRMVAGCDDVVTRRRLMVSS